MDLVKATSISASKGKVYAKNRSDYPLACTKRYYFLWSARWDKTQTFDYLEKDYNASTINYDARCQNAAINGTVEPYSHVRTPLIYVAVS